MFYDGMGQMLLVAREGHSKDKSYYATYSIDIERLRSDKIASVVVSNEYNKSSRSKSNLIFINQKDGELTALNPKDLSTKATWKG